MKKIVCVICGKEFYCHICESDKRKYCSRNCHHKGMQVTINKKCIICGKGFKTGGRKGKKSKKFCSISCSNRARYRTGAKCNKIKAIEASYIAGFLDGEGSIMITKRKDTNSCGLKIAFAQSVKGRNILDWIRKLVGTGKNLNKAPYNNCDSWGLTLAYNSEVAEGLLRQVLSYLILKKPQAELAISFQKRLRNPKLKADKEWQIEYYEKMKRLNLKGNHV